MGGASPRGSGPAVVVGDDGMEEGSDGEETSGEAGGKMVKAKKEEESMQKKKQRQALSAKLNRLVDVELGGGKGGGSRGGLRKKLADSLEGLNNSKKLRECERG